MALALAYERRQVLGADATTGSTRTPTRSAQRPPSSPFRSAQAPGATGSTPAPPTAPAKPVLHADGRFKRLSPEEMAQRRLEGLCFNCPEKFSKEHAKQCMSKGIYFLELDADVQASEDSGSDDDLKISMVAITGIQTSATLQLATVVCDAPAVALVDSGSTHSFIDESTARRLGLVPSPRPRLYVGVANGDRVAAAGVCKSVRLAIGTEEFVADLFVIPLGGVDIVLGCDWLRTLGPIL